MTRKASHPAPSTERLQKLLARAGIASRRRCEELILAGRVTVDGRVVTELGTRVDPEKAVITCDGRPVVFEEPVYILLNKPAGYVTTLSDPQGRPIVTDLLPDVPQRVFPVGRLDADTEGALILTNDGRFAQFLQHPRHEVNKTYLATVRTVPSREKLRQLEQGIILEGKKTWPARIRVVRRGRGNTLLEIIIHEGRKRQVRKMLEAIGHPCLTLKRTAYGGLRLGNLRKGQYRFLTEKDVKKIFSGKIPFTFKKIPD
ncbi:MAG: pseudouridine synthase [Desulfobulbaceae bacterium]